MYGFPVDLQLAQINIARLRQPIDHPATAAFAEALPVINGLGDTSPGFVWRLQTDSGDATSLQAFDDPMIISNLTVWDSVESLRAFAYHGEHRAYFQRRDEWFHPDGSATAMWWVVAGERPTLREARDRLEFVERFGTSPYAFRMGQRHPRVVVVRTDLRSAVAAELITSLNDELLRFDPDPAQHHFGLDPEQVPAGAGGFFVAYVDGAPMGCGAYRIIDGDSVMPGGVSLMTAEIKRMYVAPAARGRKVGAGILATLQSAAAADGAGQLVLETGDELEAATNLYRRCGFERIEPWGEYATTSYSRCYGRLL
jgi:GNAT superfamily N-acetyltransferase